MVNDIHGIPHTGEAQSLSVEPHIYKFRNDVPAKDTMIFEKVYEEDLQSNLADKTEMINAGHCTWLIVNGELAGEAQSLSVEKLNEMEGDDIKNTGDERYTTENTVYLYSFTILPKFQKKGFGKILFDRHIQELKYCGYPFFCTHATSPGMVALCKSVGAVFLQDGVHKKWYGTKRTARFCELRLAQGPEYKQSDDWSCVAYALGYLINQKVLNSVKKAGKLKIKKSETKKNPLNSLLPFLYQNLTITMWEDLYHYPISKLREELKTNPEIGTSCPSIIRFLNKYSIRFVKIVSPASLYIDIRPEWCPMIVRYREHGDDHYGVITHVGKQTIELFDPWLGFIKTVSLKQFINSWYSEKYGRAWGLTLNWKEYEAACNAL